MNKKILVVDDDALFLELVKDILAVEEIEVVVTSNGTAALSYLESERPALVLSDYEMPVMNGIRLHMAIMANPSLRDLPFVFMTGSSADELEEYVKKTGVRALNKNNLVQDIFALMKSLK
jgi:phosphoserine phosphatase RsbU/P